MGGPGGSEGQWACWFSNLVDGLAELSCGILIWRLAFSHCPLPECEGRDRSACLFLRMLLLARLVGLVLLGYADQT